MIFNSKIGAGTLRKYYLSILIKMIDEGEAEGFPRAKAKGFVTPLRLQGLIPPAARACVTLPRCRGLFLLNPLLGSGIRGSVTFGELGSDGTN